MKRVGLTIFVFTLLFSACQKEDPESIPDPAEAAYFPNTVDSYWKYERYDHENDIIDTITVSITGDTIVSDISYNIWEYDYGNHIQKLYATERNDSILFYRQHFRWTTRIYITPFELGHVWKNSIFQPDSSYVSIVEDVEINEASYQDVAVVKRDAVSFNYFLNETAWIKRGIGLVKLEKVEYNIGAYDHETWKLIETYSP